MRKRPSSNGPLMGKLMSRGRNKGHGNLAGRPPSQRQLRVGEELRHVLAAVMERHELHDPMLAGIDVTVTEVRISPDLKNATVFVATMDHGGVEDTVVALDRASPFLRRRIGERVRLRHVPRLRFEADRSFDNADRIDALLHRIDAPAPGPEAED